MYRVDRCLYLSTRTIKSFLLMVNSNKKLEKIKYKFYYIFFKLWNLIFLNLLEHFYLSTKQKESFYSQF